METHIEKRFYVPEPEEFCLGFEYDHANYGGKLVVGAQIEKEWITTIVEDSYDFNSVWDVYNEGKQCTDIRVKLLDSQDIIDCGFGNKKKSVWDWYELNKTFRMRSGHHISKIKLIHDRSNEFLEVTDGDICPNIKIWGDFSGTDEVLFEGLIKNKTEFKKLLKQIGVYEN